METPSEPHSVQPEHDGLGRLREAVMSQCLGLDGLPGNDDLAPESDFGAGGNSGDENYTVAYKRFFQSFLSEREYDIMRRIISGEPLQEDEKSSWGAVKKNKLGHPAVMGKLAREHQDAQSDLIAQIGGAEWKKSASCAGDHRFVKPRAAGNQIQEDAKNICGGCPVQEQCLSHVEENRPKQGIWAGLLRSGVQGYHEDGRPITLQELE